MTIFSSATSVAMVATMAIVVTSCGSDSSSPSPPPAGGGGSAAYAGMGGAGGTGAAGATAGGSGEAGSGSLGTGGAAGKPTYEAPTWAPVAGAPAECNIEQITNVANVGPAFAWVPCLESTGTPGCEETQFRGPFQLPEHFGITAAEIFDDGATATVAIYSVDLNDLTTSHVIVARMDGTVLFVLRQSSDPLVCGLGTPSLGAGRFSATVSLTLPNSPLVAYAFLAPLEPQPTFAIANIGSIGAGAFGPSGRSAFSNGRVSFNWGGVRNHTAKWEDGSGLALISPTNNTFLETDARATPDGFLMEVFSGPNDLWFSDGLQPATLLLKDPTATLSMAQVLGMNLVWFRGSDPDPDAVDYPTYGKIELWTSPYSSDPAQLVPTKLADTPFTTFHAYNGGFDWAVTAGAAGADDRTLQVWHIPDGEHRTSLLGSTVGISDIGGVYRDGMVFAVWHPSDSKTAAGHTVYRVPFASMNVVP